MSESSGSVGSYFALSVMLLGILCGAGLICIDELSNNEGIIVAAMGLLISFESVAFVLGWHFLHHICGKLAMIGAGLIFLLLLINTAIYFDLLWHSPVMTAPM